MSTKYHKLKLNYTHNNISHDRNIAYTTWGDATKPVILCVHALTRNARDFDFLAENLSQDYYILCVDVVGRGQSDYAIDHNHYNYETYINDIKNFLSQHKIEKLTWIGSSMGGIIGMLFAELYPQMITKLILNDVGPFIPKQALKRIAKYIGLVPIFNNLSSLEKHLKMIFAPFGITEDHHWQHMIKHGHRILEDGKYTLAYDPKIAKVTFKENIEEINDVDLWDIWIKLTIPILILRGSLSDILLKETFDQMIAKYNVCGIEYVNIGHTPSLMSDNQINDIKQWLKSSQSS